MNEAKYRPGQNSGIPSGDSHRTLDELFADARSDAGYLEGEQAKRSLLGQVMDRNSTQSYSPLRHWTLRRGPYFNLGATIMTTLSLGAAAILVFSLFNSSPQPYHSSITGHATTQQNSSYQSIARVPASIDGMASQQPLQSAMFSDGQSVTPKRDTGWPAPISIEGIKPVTVTAEQAHQLGIELPADGNIIYRFQSEDGRGSVTHIYKPNGESQMSLMISDTNNGKNLTVTVPSSLLRMITNVDGEKRFFHFDNGFVVLGHSHDSANGKFRSNSRWSLMVDNAPGDSTLSQRLVRETNITTDENTDIPEMSDEPNAMNEVTINLHKATEATNSISKVIIAVSQSIGLDSVIGVDGVDGIASGVDGIAGVGGITPAMPATPAMPPLPPAPAMPPAPPMPPISSAPPVPHSHIIAKRLHVKLDTNHIKKLVEWNIRNCDTNLQKWDLNIKDNDTNLKNWEMQMQDWGKRFVERDSEFAERSKEFSIRGQEFAKRGKEFAKRGEEFAKRSKEWADKMATYQPDVDKLIPLLIKNTNNPDKPNALIFWYDSTPQLAAVCGTLPAPPIASVNTTKNVNGLR